MKNKKRMIIILSAAAACILIIAAAILIFRGNSSGEDFSNIRACRPISGLNADIPSEQEFFTIDPPPSYTDQREQVLEAYTILNNERQNAGLPALRWDQRLEDDALIRAMELCELFDKDHRRPDGQDWFTVDSGFLLAENIYRGSADAGKAMESWMAHPADAENFMSAEYTRGAIAVYTDESGNAFWAAEFSADTP